MISKEQLELYAKKLMFKMNDEEYETLEEEFNIILKQMELIGKINNIKDVEPMTYPFELFEATLREDEIDNDNIIDTKDVLLNVKVVEKNQVRVPKVVE